MSEVKTRRTSVSVLVNGKNVDGPLGKYLESFEYTDVASGESDSISIALNNSDLIWMGAYHPTKGDSLQASITFHDWDKTGDTKKLKCGKHVIDDFECSGGPRTAKIKAVSSPAKESFLKTERNKTWKEVTIQKILSEISSKYGLSGVFDATDINIKTIEQSNKSDSEFLKSVCDDYGLAMKIYNKKIVIYDKGRYESKGTVATIDINDWIADSWIYNDTLYGTYTGGTISYKKSTDDKEINITVGSTKRLLRLTESADNEAEARRKVRSKVNQANESATTLSGEIWANPKITSASTVKVKGLKKANGKYFVDKVTYSVNSSGGTTMNIEMHKIYKRL